MAFYDELSGAVGILKESIQLLPKNGKLMAFLTLLYIAMSSIFFSIFRFSVKSLIRDILVKESFFPISSSKNSAYISLLAGLKKDLALFFLIYVVYLIAFFIISLFSTIATILLSALSYSEKNISLKSLLLRVLKSWIRPLITGFYTMLLVIGYFFFVFLMASPLLMYSDRSHLSVAILVIFAHIFYLYLSVTWILALVVSVIEEDCFGIQALGKAGGLVKGKRVQGFVLNLLLNLSLILYQDLWITRGHKWRANPTAIAIFTLCITCLVKIIGLVAFTVFYFHCKKNHGEEIELQGNLDSFEYRKIYETTLLVNDDVLQV